MAGSTSAGWYAGAMSVPACRCVSVANSVASTLSYARNTKIPLVPADERVVVPLLVRWPGAALIAWLLVGHPLGAISGARRAARGRRSRLVPDSGFQPLAGDLWQVGEALLLPVFAVGGECNPQGARQQPLAEAGGSMRSSA